jgi:translation initiation factor 2 gamma subunit (eIF-2gamma)
MEKVEKGLAQSKEVRRISRIDIPGKEQSLFSVAILGGSGSDATVMKATDTAPQRHTAHLPYEFLVSGGKAVMLHGKFRIAQSFPDLTMGTFMKISGAPAAIEDAIRGAVR